MSEFAHDSYPVRLQAALDIITTSEETLKGLQEQQAQTSDPIQREVLTYRILALIHHIESWRRYVDDGCPLEPRAQISVSHYPS